MPDSPAVLVHGPRQSGKTTLVKLVGGPRGYHFISLDDEVALTAAENDPVGFVAGLPNGVILDEVQRAPSLFTSLKQEIDRNRVPGRFLLTGSSQVLPLPMLSDSLAGRLEIIRLHPLSQCEIKGGIPNFLDDLFGRGFETSITDRLGDGLESRIASGGYPAALIRPTHRRRASWYRNHIETQLLSSNCFESQRDWVRGLVAGWFQDEPYLSMELRITSSLRMQAVGASFFGLPADNRR